MVSIFRFLHWFVIALFWAFWLVVGFWVYQHRLALQPAADYVELLWNMDPRAAKQRPPLSLSGRVTKANSGDGLQLRNDGGLLFNYGLSGLAAPRADRLSPPAQRALADLCQSNLNQLAVGQWVDIDVWLANPETRTGLGVFRMGETNLNALALEWGIATLRREQIRGLPLREQYAMVQAERAARRERRGVWSTNFTVPADPIPPGIPTDATPAKAFNPGGR